MPHRHLALTSLLALLPLAGAAAEQVPDPEVLMPRQRLDMQEMLGDGAPKPKFTQEPGATATEIRNTGKGMSAAVRAEMSLPRALASWAELAGIQPALPLKAPWLPQLLSTAQPQVSPLHHALYQAKWEDTNRRILEGLPSQTAKEAYDLDAVWEIPASGGRPAALLLHGRFSLRADTEPAKFLSGPIGNPTETFFSPRTAYRWHSAGSHASATDKVKAALRIQTELQREYAIRGLPRARNRELEAGLAQRKAELEDLPKWHYLNGDELPFISLPLLFRQFPGYKFAPELGDLAVVISGQGVSPAIWGDETADAQVGQISSALARELQRTAQPAAAAPATLVVPAPLPPLNRDQQYELTVILFLKTAPGEPRDITFAELREKVGKFTPLPEPPPPPAPIAVAPTAEATAAPAASAAPATDAATAAGQSAAPEILAPATGEAPASGTPAQ